MRSIRTTHLRTGPRAPLDKVTGASGQVPEPSGGPPFPAVPAPRGAR